MLYYLYCAGVFIARILPKQVCYVIAIVIARGIYFVSRKNRLALRANMRVVLGEDADKALVNKTVRGVLINFAKYLADFFKFTRFTEESLERTVEVTGRHNLDRCLSEGKGAINLSAHLGNWEMGGAVVGAMGYPLNAIVLEHKDKRINDYFTQQRAINNMKVIPLGFGVRKCFTILKSNELIAIVGDKDYTGDTKSVEFFGRQALLPRGPAVLSLKTDAPLVPTFLIRKKDNCFKLIFGEPIKGEKSGDSDRDVEALMRKYLSVFERYIREYPEQWYAFEEVWSR